MRAAWTRLDGGTRLYLVTFALVQVTPLVIQALTDSGGRVATEFYSASAQIVPVLLVALFVELGFRSRGLVNVFEEQRSIERDFEVLKRQHREYTELKVELLHKGKVPREALEARDPQELEGRIRDAQRRAAPPSLFWWHKRRTPDEAPR